MSHRATTEKLTKCQSPRFSIIIVVPAGIAVVGFRAIRQPAGAGELQSRKPGCPSPPGAPASSCKPQEQRSPHLPLGGSLPLFLSLPPSLPSIIRYVLSTFQCQSLFSMLTIQFRTSLTSALLKKPTFGWEKQTMKN